MYCVISLLKKAQTQWRNETAKSMKTRIQELETITLT